MENGTAQILDDVAPEVIAERRLWTAVIVHAVQDWLSGTLREKREAQRFLFEEGGDFLEVCACAGIDPSSFRSRLLRAGRQVQLQGPLARPLAA
ncbi:MAG TPA: hypothetical protein VMF66_18325 [Candidatus Acidoferrum sp.]|nr:hypothetical protein [Candidatus Acidoferrum sp.]